MEPLTEIPKLYYRKNTANRRTFITWSKAIHFQFKIDGTYYNIEIPPNYEFDLSSVPRVFWTLLAPFELGDIAPIVHDWIYKDAPEGAFTRKQADQIYYQLMLSEGIPKPRAKIAYIALRIGGWSQWRSKQT